MKYILVLQDGETYTGLAGCAIVAVPDDADAESIEEQLDADNGADYVVTFSEVGGRIIATAPGGDVWMSHA